MLWMWMVAGQCALSLNTHRKHVRMHQQPGSETYALCTYSIDVRMCLAVQTLQRKPCSDTLPSTLVDKHLSDTRPCTNVPECPALAGRDAVAVKDYLSRAVSQCHPQRRQHAGAAAGVHIRGQFRVLQRQLRPQQPARRPVGIGKSVLGIGTRGLQLMTAKTVTGHLDSRKHGIGTH